MTTFATRALNEVPDGFLMSEVEDAEFYRSTRHTLPGFRMEVAEVASDGQGRLIAPYFVTTFNLGTMLDKGPLRTVANKVGLRIACVGHPITAFGRMEGEVNAVHLASLASFLARQAPVVCFKGFDDTLPLPEFVKVRGLPAAVLEFDEVRWSDIRRSRNIRRKLKDCAGLRFEEHQEPPPHLLDRMYELYCATQARAKTQFGLLTRDYFVNTARSGFYTLLFADAQLVGFAQVLFKNDQAVASFMGMDYSVNERYGLYFAIVIRIVDLAASRGFRSIEMGETSYSFKRKIGCELIPTWIYYRHRNPLLNQILKRVAWMLEPSDDELK